MLCKHLHFYEETGSAWLRYTPIFFNISLFGDMLCKHLHFFEEAGSAWLRYTPNYSTYSLYRVAIKLLPDLAYYIQVATNEEADITHLLD